MQHLEVRTHKTSKYKYLKRCLVDILLIVKITYLVIQENSHINWTHYNGSFFD